MSDQILIDKYTELGECHVMALGQIDALKAELIEARKPKDNSEALEALGKLVILSGIESRENYNIVRRALGGT